MPMAMCWYKSDANVDEKGSDKESKTLGREKVEAEGPKR
jgi:hypothetical protein